MNALSKDASIDAGRLSLPGVPAPRLDPDSARDYARYRHLSNGLRLTMDDIKRFAAGVVDGIRFILERNAERRIIQEVERLSARQRSDIGIAPSSAAVFANAANEPIFWCRAWPRGL